MNYRDWLGAELVSSADWHRNVDRRRAEAMKPRRTASCYSIASYATFAELEASYEEWQTMPRPTRPYAWREERVERHSYDPAPNEPADHLRRYRAGVRADERRWLGATCSLEALHGLYSSPTGVLPSIPSVLAIYPAPTGPQASLAAARLTGADWGTDEARRQAFRRASPRCLERFDVILTSADLKAKQGS